MAELKNKMLFIHEGHVERVRKRLTSKRYKHTLGVVETAIKLAEYYGGDIEKTFLAALYHDYAKSYSDQEIMDAARQYQLTLDETMIHVPSLAHGFIAAAEIEHELGIKDVEVLDAMRYHTIGRLNMTQIDKIIYLADAIEPGREFPGVEKLRKIAYKDLDGALIEAIGITISYVILSGNNELVHPNSVELRNQLIIRRKA